MKRKRKAGKIIGLIAAAAVLAIVAYYCVEVLIARAVTRKTVDDLYASGKIETSAETLSQRQQDILLAVEDPNFYGHHGVDFSTPGAGWTTITQGLAKQLYFADFHSGIMKIKQTLCAWLALDPLVSKQTQLELYINMMCFGNGVYGIGDAAQYYYNKTVPELTEREFISLIACLIDPTELNAKEHPAENALRVIRIEKLLSGEYEPQGVFDITYEGAG
jgi:membrane carboxypeptidase/penicillin-binding protein